MSTNIDISTIEDFKSSDFPLVIAGPCSAESQEQVMQTAIELAKISKVKYYRAGLWKPRTRPDGFEGVGSAALPWLEEAKKETGLKMVVEVAKPKHIEKCLGAGIDMVWIGARTTANPFSVQELAEALRGVKIPVLVKNPLHPDIKLWIGALERINAVGITKIAAVHRGFFNYDNGPYRNLPMWEISIELKRLIPNLPIICDPSHISGRRELLFEIAQKSFDLAMDGLMIESHINPSNAKTDAAQQLKPADLKTLLNNLIIRKEYGSNDFEIMLENIRREVDDIDSELLQILYRRMGKIEEIGRYKKENNITILQIDRLRKMIKSRLKTGNELGLDNKFLLKLLQLVHKESIQIQTKIMNDDKL